LEELLLSLKIVSLVAMIGCELTWRLVVLGDMLKQDKKRYKGKTRVKRR
jgi:hypothetical protein